MPDPITLGGYGLAILLGLFGFKMKRGDVWKDEAEAQKAKADRLEKDLSVFRADFDIYVRSSEQRFDNYRRDMGVRVSKLETENKRLGELASGAEAVAKLAVQIQRNHSEIMTYLAPHLAAAALTHGGLPAQISVDLNGSVNTNG